MSDINPAKKPLFIALIAVVLLIAISASIYSVRSAKKDSLSANSGSQIDIGSKTGDHHEAGKISPHQEAVTSRGQVIVCAPEDQSCDTRSQASRTIAYRNMRDRHAERD